MWIGWLLEVGGEYVFIFVCYVDEVLLLFVDLKIGQCFVLVSQIWMVSNVENVECVVGQGELLFKVGVGYLVVVVDL